MTEKQLRYMRAFLVGSSEFVIDDNATHERLKKYDILDRLNKQHETIQEKQHTINEMAKALRTYDDGYIGLNKENQRLLKANMDLTEENTNILSTIRTAYQNERTNIGRMVLKQLLDNLE